MKKIIAAALSAILLVPALITGCKPTDGQTGTLPDVTDTELTESVTDEVTEPQETEEIIVDEEPVFYEKTDRDPADPKTTVVEGTDWSSSILTANAYADGVQGKFTDAGRRSFLITNNNASLLYELAENGGKQIRGLYSKNGAPYFENTSDAFITDGDGVLYSAALSGVITIMISASAIRISSRSRPSRRRATVKSFTTSSPRPADGARTIRAR